MSVRQGILALLAEGPSHCYQLRQRFEERTGGTWPLNIGQVYSTVQRLVRDGLVEPVDDGPQATDGGGASVVDETPAPGAPRGSAARPHGVKVQNRADDVERFRLTEAGRAEVTRWWVTPVARSAPARDELAIKIALAVTSPGVDVLAVVQAQRTETMRALRDFTRLAGEQGPDLTWALVLDNLVFTTEAEIRWLDHVEARIARATTAGTTTSASPAPAAAPAPGASAPPEAHTPPPGTASGTPR